MTPFDAVVAAGGGSTRMRSGDKTRMLVGDRTMLDRVLVACASAEQVVVVGPERPTAVPVTWTREAPPGGGPAAAVAAGLALVTSPVTVVLAADLPMVTADLVNRMAALVRDAGVVVVDGDGRRQWLCSAWPTGELRRAALVAGSSLHAAFESLAFTTVGAGPAAWLDCDTPEDLRRAREQA